jgi:hypothetical protein
MGKDLEGSSGGTVEEMSWCLPRGTKKSYENPQSG